jgi:hypothetical protein
MTFGNWDSAIHKDFEQLKRIASSQRITPENITLNSEHESAEIIGTDGIYNVSLYDCTCYDFQTRRLPCKHIYRLASELGFLSDLPKLNREAAKMFNDSIPEEIERYKKLYFDGAISIEKLNKIVNALQSK